MSKTLPSILYIDDDEGLRRLTGRALERAGYHVALAADGPEGIRMASEHMFDLVAVDYYMPGLDGLQTLAALQNLPAPPPVIFVTGSDESQLAVSALKAGAIDYIVKSVNADYFDLLAQTIVQALATVKLRRLNAQTAEQLRETNARLQVLLHEVNHRVANGLQLVSAFIHMQARELKDDGAKTALEDTQRRIVAIAQVHKRLYTSSSVEAVDMVDYLTALIEELDATWSTPEARRTIQLRAQPLMLHPDRAVAVGIIVNELVSNACKYAYATDTPGEIRVILTSNAADSFQLIVEDDGCGITEAGGTKGTGLGTKVVGAMAATVRGTLAYETSTPGLRVRLDVPRIANAAAAD